MFVRSAAIDMDGATIATHNMQLRSSTVLAYLAQVRVVMMLTASCFNYP